MGANLETEGARWAAVAWEIAVLSMAVVTSVFAGTLPWLRLDEVPRDAWERKTAFALLVGDAFYEWWAFAHFGDDVGDATWVTTLVVLLSAGVVLAVFLWLRGFELPSLLRWPLVACLGIVQPVLLALSFVGVNGPIPLW